MSDIKESWHYDETEDRLTCYREQDVEPYLNRNKSEYDVDNKRFKSETFNKVASIPNMVIEKWLREEGLDIFNPDHQERLRLKLNDPAYRFLRTKPGRI
jgi:hypothetical protein